MLSPTQASLGLAGNQLTGDVPISLVNKSCIYQVQVQRPVSVCQAGSVEVGAAATTLTQAGNVQWLRANCEPCAAGTFSGAAGAVVCTPCEPGYYSLSDGTGCLPCDAGSFLNATSGVCDACWPGSFSARGALTCSPCQANTYAAADGTSCLSCPDGSTSFAGSPALNACTCTAGSVPQYAAGATFVCQPCPAGTEHDVVTNECMPCPSNSYNGVRGSTTCTPVDAGFVVILNGTAQAPCPAGSYLNVSECAMCQPGTFSATQGATTCPSCPPATISATGGATACDACPASSSDGLGNTVCLCLDGYYDVALGANTSAPQCTSCADGGACVGGVLLAQEGWWRESPTDDLFLKCREGYCLAEDPPASSARRRLAQADAGHCLDGHSGVLCAICQDGYTLQGGFCKPCRQEDAWRSWSRASRGVTIALFVPAGFLLLTLLLLLPLLPAWESAMWRCTTMLAVAAESVGGAIGALRRCCCGGGDAAEVAPRRSSTRVSIGRRSSAPRWSAVAVGRASASSQPALEDAPAESGDAGGAEVTDVAVADGINALFEAAVELFTALARPGKILIKCVSFCPACGTPGRLRATPLRLRAQFLPDVRLS